MALDDVGCAAAGGRGRGRRGYDELVVEEMVDSGEGEGEGEVMSGCVGGFFFSNGRLSFLFSFSIYLYIYS